MPKLKDHDVERKKAAIEKAALKVFIRQGYHGTSMRDIAKISGVSLGNIYNYYSTKEALFQRIVERYEARMEPLRAGVLGSVDGVFTAAGLDRLAEGIRKIVYGNPDYWRLMYIDVVEFGNRHFAGSFRKLATNLEERLGDRLRAATRCGEWNGVDPALAFTAIYLQFFTYFLVEKLFGGRQHLGVPDQEAVQQLISMMSHGIWQKPPAREATPAAPVTRTKVNPKNSDRNQED
jgi:AcrR family transcriptional regulator